MLILLLPVLRGGGGRSTFQLGYTYLKTGAFEQKRRKKKGGVDGEHNEKDIFVTITRGELLFILSLSSPTGRIARRICLSYWALFAHLNPLPLPLLTLT